MRFADIVSPWAQKTNQLDDKEYSSRRIAERLKADENHVHGLIRLRSSHSDGAWQRKHWRQSFIIEPAIHAAGSAHGKSGGQAAEQESQNFEERNYLRRQSFRRAARRID
jgi:hypothetical protein